LTNNPPYEAEVTFENAVNANGWSSPPLTSWLSNALDEAASLYFGKKHLSQGEGGSIPFLGLLGAIWPKAQFIVTGVLGPNSNAHGPNEFLHIDYTLRLTQAIAHVLARASEAK
jgi:acetylornithine deacetylase/succinyl-diaminopimelate desuccinylase-like protein